MKGLADAIDPLLSPFPPSQQVQAGAKSEFPINLANTIDLTLVIPSDLDMPNSPAQPQPLSGAFPHQLSALDCTAEFPKTSQISTNSKQEVAGLGMPCTSC